ncbi:hypothetical protein FHS72_000236 [Loktanella ponticola]|uniref:Uncharacterized protein n=1 Tax=Yoonia ponticola TaxID=1524255 RepID=A0A7W9BI15_9RHOB|nr:hypothetical protein [Yoonia ponticola]MBB5720632.1 hypothetical protein [Yoonia ponticola]
MRNMHPADELAVIRTDIRKLREREDFLCKGFVSLRFSTQGVDTLATTKIVKERRLRQELLPKNLLKDPELWETKVTRHVHLNTLRCGRTPLPACNMDATYDVIEQF